MLETGDDFALFAFTHLVRIVELLKKLDWIVDSIDSQVHVIDADVVDPDSSAVGGAVSSIGRQREVRLVIGCGSRS